MDDGHAEETQQQQQESVIGRLHQDEARTRGADSTFGAEASGDVGFGRGDVGQTQRAFVKVLIGEEVSQADVGGFLCDVHAELLQEDKDTEEAFRI